MTVTPSYKCQNLLIFSSVKFVLCNLVYFNFFEFNFSWEVYCLFIIKLEKLRLMPLIQDLDQENFMKSKFTVLSFSNLLHNVYPALGHSNLTKLNWFFVMFRRRRRRVQRKGIDIMQKNQKELWILIAWNLSDLLETYPCRIIKLPLSQNSRRILAK